MIIFSDHAKIKIKQRNLDNTKIIKTIHKPDRVTESYNNRKIAEKNFGKLNLRVIFIEEYHNIIVVTAHWKDKRQV